MGLFKQRGSMAKASLSAPVNSLEEMTNCGLACMNYCKRQWDWMSLVNAPCYFLFLHLPLQITFCVIHRLKILGVMKAVLILTESQISFYRFKHPMCLVHLLSKPVDVPLLIAVGVGPSVCICVANVSFIESRYLN